MAFTLSVLPKRRNSQQREVAISAPATCYRHERPRPLSTERPRGQLLIAVPYRRPATPPAPHGEQGGASPDKPLSSPRQPAAGPWLAHRRRPHTERITATSRVAAAIDATTLPCRRRTRPVGVRDGGPDQRGAGGPAARGGRRARPSAVRRHGPASRTAQQRHRAAAGGAAGRQVRDAGRGGGPGANRKLRNFCAGTRDLGPPSDHPLPYFASPQPR